MAEIRRFTKEDWYGLAGATKFKNGSEPFIYEGTFPLNDESVWLQIVADAEGVDIHLGGGDDGDSADVWAMNKELSSRRAEGEMRAIVDYIKDNIKYAPDLAYLLDHKSGIFKDFNYLGEFTI